MEVVVGQGKILRRTFSQEDFNRFAALSGDDNPIHVDPEFCAKFWFRKPVCHGMLMYSTICRVLGTQIPGPGTVPLEQELMFTGPLYAGEEVMVWAGVTKIQREQQLAELDTLIIKQDGAMVCRGRALVRLPESIVSKKVAGPRKEEPIASMERPEKPSEESVKGLKVGQKATVKRIFTREDLEERADLTGDTNPIFIDESYASKTLFGRPIVPPDMLGGMFSYLLGTKLPGRGTHWLKQRLMFPAPAYPGEEITASVEITRLRHRHEKELVLVNLSTVCTNPAGEVVCEGEALVLTMDPDISSLQTSIMTSSL